MNPDKQRLKIAIAAGYRKTLCPAGEVEWCGPAPERELIGRFASETVPSRIPDYPNSLDAMHAAEKALEAWQVAPYLKVLAKLTGNKNTVYHADAEQRAEAFLRVLGLWEEGN